jgi:hypothetical protein
MMAALKAHQPNANFFVNGRTYKSDEQSLIANVHPDDVAGLLNCGCVVTEPFSIARPRVEEKPAVLAKPATIRLRGKPWMNYQPATDARFHADGDGFLDVPPQHVKALLRAGCAHVDEEGREFGSTAPAA